MQDSAMASFFLVPVKIRIHGKAEPRNARKELKDVGLLLPSLPPSLPSRLAKEKTTLVGLLGNSPRSWLLKLGSRNTVTRISEWHLWRQHGRVLAVRTTQRAPQFVEQSGLFPDRRLCG